MDNSVPDKVEFTHNLQDVTYSHPNLRQFVTKATLNGEKNEMSGADVSIMKYFQDGAMKNNIRILSVMEITRSTLKANSIAQDEAKSLSNGRSTQVSR